MVSEHKKIKKVSLLAKKYATSSYTIFIKTQKVTEMQGIKIFFVKNF